MKVEAGICFFYRNMVLQNEVVDADDDLEHFEDIAENDGNQAVPATTDNSDKKGQVAESSHASDDDSEESLLEGGSATSDSEEDGHDEADGLFGEGDFKAVKSKSTGDFEVCSDQGPTPPPGGYNPRHREPTYW